MTVSAVVYHGCASEGVICSITLVTIDLYFVLLAIPDVVYRSCTSRGGSCFFPFRNSYFARGITQTLARNGVNALVYVQSYHVEARVDISPVILTWYGLLTTAARAYRFARLLTTQLTLTLMVMRSVLVLLPHKALL